MSEAKHIVLQRAPNQTYIPRFTGCCLKNSSMGFNPTSAYGQRMPEAAIEKLRQFAASNSQMAPEQLAGVEIAMAGIYFNNLKDTDKAVQVLDAGMARSDHSYSYLVLV